MTWIPGNQKFPAFFTSDRVPHGLARQIVIGFHSPGSDLFYHHQGDIDSAQLLIRAQIPTEAQRPQAINQGLLDLGR
ncbi:hypothetical protein LCGC14_1511410 [marine sediment metagenome]|uniref:Uncharacterized protein n=1 Tax=marine sediment metagenome TaxID=412755 RepID=A0A0F9JM14_9ZZZZ